MGVYNSGQPNIFLGSSFLIHKRGITYSVTGLVLAPKATMEINIFFLLRFHSRLDLKVHNSLVFSTFTELYSHQHIPVQNIFFTSKRNSILISNHYPSHPHPQSQATTKLAVSLFVSSLDILCKWNHTILVSSCFHLAWSPWFIPFWSMAQYSIHKKKEWILWLNKIPLYG